MQRHHPSGLRFLLERLGAHYLPQRTASSSARPGSLSAGIDMALYLGAKLVNEQRARGAQLSIEYNPQPPHGGIDGSHIDRQMMVPTLSQR